MQARTAMFRMFERAGFTLVRCNRHAIWRCPCGHAQIISSATVGDRHGADNARRDIARTLRACTPESQRRAA